MFSPNMSNSWPYIGCWQKHGEECAFGVSVCCHHLEKHGYSSKTVTDSLAPGGVFIGVRLSLTDWFQQARDLLKQVIFYWLNGSCGNLFPLLQKKSVFSKFTGISLFLVLLLVFIQSTPKGRLSVGKIFTMVIVFLQGKILLMRIWCLVYVSVCVILLWIFFKSLSESFGRTVSAQKLHVRHQCRYWRNEIRKYPVPKHLEHISEQWPPIPRPDHENQAQRFSESVSDTQAASSFTSDMNYFNWLVVFRYDR